MSDIPTIDTNADLAVAIQTLTKDNNDMERAFQAVGLPALRRVRPGFSALAKIIVGQQVSTQAAAAIWSRLDAHGLTKRSAVAAAAPEDLGTVGLSRPKQKYLLQIARSDLDFADFGTLSDSDARARLLALPGVGPWTADVYLLTALGRCDVFPAGDIALQEAAKHLLGRDQRPDFHEMTQIAKGWSPWRAVAARLLWAYYAKIKGREGLAK